MFYDWFGEVSESEESDAGLESYLISSPNESLDSDSQGMARTKQTARKQTTPTAGTSAGGFPLATHSSQSTRRSPRFDLDSSIERATDLLNSNSEMSKKSPRRSSPCKKLSQSGFTSGEDNTPSWATGDEPWNIGGRKEPPRKDIRQNQWKGKPSMKELCVTWNRRLRLVYRKVRLHGIGCRRQRKRGTHRDEY